jgi:hypothetical protein
MSRGMPPEIDAEHILFGFNRGFYASKEKQSHLDDMAESYMNTLSINMSKRGSMLRTACHKRNFSKIPKR